MPSLSGHPTPDRPTNPPECDAPRRAVETDDECPGGCGERVYACACGETETDEEN